MRLDPRSVENSLRAFLPHLYSLPPLRLARVILKNRPKNGQFGLHKSIFHVFMRATREGRAIEISSLLRLGNLRSSPRRCRRFSPLRCLGFSPKGLRLSGTPCFAVAGRSHCSDASAFPQKAGAFRGPRFSVEMTKLQLAIPRAAEGSHA